MRRNSFSLISEYAEYFNETYLDAYLALIDMGEIRESESMRKRCETFDRNIVAVAARDLKSGAKSSLEILDDLFA